jgi:hypothetical protein
VPDLRSVVAVTAAVTFGLFGSASAQDFVVDPGTAASNLSLAIELPFDGTLIGDYDAKANPTGTQTRPGLFGGSGNNPIGYSATLTLGVPGTTSSPTGGISIDTTLAPIGLVGVDAFQVDLLAGSTTSVGTELLLVYETFNTVNPFSIYPGGFEIPVPLAGAEIRSSELSLTLPTVLVGIPVGDELSLTGSIPVLWSIEIDFGLDLGVQAIDLPVNLPITAMLAGDGENQTFSVQADFSTLLELAIDLPPFESIAIGLPTIPPSANEANLLFGGSVTAIRLDIALGLDIVGVPGFIPAPADVNEDGIVNSADLGLVIGAWGVCDGCREDISGDGFVNAIDIGLLIAGWSF